MSTLAIQTTVVPVQSGRVQLAVQSKGDGPPLAVMDMSMLSPCTTGIVDIAVTRDPAHSKTTDTFRLPLRPRTTLGMMGGG
jgi:hypothetical protein